MKTKEELNALKKEPVELTEEWLEHVSGGGDPCVDLSSEFEHILDKETFPGTDYTVVRGNRETPIY